MENKIGHPSKTDKPGSKKTLSRIKEICLDYSAVAKMLQLENIKKLDKKSTVDFKASYTSMRVEKMKVVRNV